MFSWIERWLKRLKLLRISRIAIPVAIILLVFFAAFTIYGNKVGNFVINVDKQGPSIGVSMEEDLSDVTSIISVAGMDEQGLATYEYIPSDISDGVGLKSDYVKYEYFAVSFYLVNLSDRTVDYDVQLNILDNIGVGTDILRCLVIEGDASEGTIYAKPEENEEDKEELQSQLTKFKYYESVDFVSDNIAMAKRVTDFASGDRIKYTVVLWMEGCDKLAVDGCEGSRVKMSMDFVAY